LQFKILIIESDKTVLDSVSKLLIEADYKPICTGDYEQGMKLLEKNNFSLILCAANIANANGHIFLQRLIQRPKIGSTPFIFLTNKIAKEDIQHASSLGADGYIFKPIEPDKLLATIERRLAKYSEFSSKKENNMDLSGMESNLTCAVKKLSIDDYLFRMIEGQPTFIKVGNVKYIISQNTYSKVFLSDGRSYRLKKTLTEIENLLPIRNFIRIHRSSIINIDFVSKIEKWFNNSFRVYLRDVNTPLEMSRRYSSLIKDRFYF
jgi:DNA-binding LytR/AlgR family response regulator